LLRLSPWQNARTALLQAPVEIRIERTPYLQSQTTARRSSDGKLLVYIPSIDSDVTFTSWRYASGAHSVAVEVDYVGGAPGPSFH
jgi:hypothetical protein